MHRFSIHRSYQIGICLNSYLIQLGTLLLRLSACKQVRNVLHQFPQAEERLWFFEIRDHVRQTIEISGFGLPHRIHCPGPFKFLAAQNHSKFFSVGKRHGKHGAQVAQNRQKDMKLPCRMVRVFRIHHFLDIGQAPRGRSHSQCFENPRQVGQYLDF